MNIVFAHDHRFKEDAYGNLYSGNDFNKNIWDRYKSIGNKITIIARCEYVKDEKDLKGYTLLKDEDIKIIKLPNLNDLKTLMKNYKSAKELIQKEVEASDGVIVRLPSTIGNMVCSVAKKQNKKYFIELVGCPWDAFWNYGTMSGKLVAPIYYLKTKFKVSNSNYVIYVTNKFLQNRYPNKNINIGCSDVNISRINEDELKSKIKALYNKEIFNIGLIGSLDVNYKGHYIALNAIQNLVNEGYKVRLKFLGPGNSERWEKLSTELDIHQNVCFDGLRKSGEEVHRWLDDIDIYIQPSLQEGLPRAVIEAQARGCAVIVSNCGGMRELVDEEFIIRKKNHKQLSDKIKSLINDNNKMKDQCIKNYEHSKAYEKNNLENKRNNFYKVFKDDITM